MNRWMLALFSLGLILFAPGVQASTSSGDGAYTLHVGDSVVINSGYRVELADISSVPAYPLPRVSFLIYDPSGVLTTQITTDSSQGAMTRPEAWDTRVSVQSASAGASGVEAYAVVTLTSGIIYPSCGTPNGDGHFDLWRLDCTRAASNGIALVMTNLFPGKAVFKVQGYNAMSGNLLDVPLATSQTAFTSDGRTVTLTLNKAYPDAARTNAYADITLSSANATPSPTPTFTPTPTLIPTPTASAFPPVSCHDASGDGSSITLCVANKDTASNGLQVILTGVSGYGGSPYLTYASFEAVGGNSDDTFTLQAGQSHRLVAMDGRVVVVSLASAYPGAYGAVAYAQISVSSLPAPVPATSCPGGSSPRSLELGYFHNGPYGYWSSLGLDISAHPEILKYRIKWGGGLYSPWFVPGANDVDSQDYGRRYWTYFDDHQFQVVVCGNATVFDAQPTILPTVTPTVPPNDACNNNLYLNYGFHGDGTYTMCLGYLAVASNGLSVTLKDISGFSYGGGKPKAAFVVSGTGATSYATIGEGGQSTVGAGDLAVTLSALKVFPGAFAHQAYAVVKIESQGFNATPTPAPTPTPVPYPNETFQTTLVLSAGWNMISSPYSQSAYGFPFPCGRGMACPQPVYPPIAPVSGSSSGAGEGHDGVKIASKTIETGANVAASDDGEGRDSESGPAATSAPGNRIAMPVYLNGGRVTQSTCAEVPLWHYHAKSKRYDKTGSLALNSLVPGGDGYWVKMPANCTVTISGSAKVTLEGYGLSQGWNQFGAPGDSASFADLSRSCSVTGGPWAFDAAAQKYVAASSLQPGVGYFVKVSDACSLGATEDLPPLPAG